MIPGKLDHSDLRPEHDRAHSSQYLIDQFGFSSDTAAEVRSVAAGPSLRKLRNRLSEPYLPNGRWREKHAVIMQIADKGESARTLAAQLILEYERSHCFPVHIAILQALTKIGADDPKSIRFIVGKLYNPRDWRTVADYPAERAAAAYALSQLGDERVMIALQRAASPEFESDALVRDAAAAALNQLSTRLGLIASVE